MEKISLWYELTLCVDLYAVLSVLLTQRLLCHVYNELMIESKYFRLALKTDPQNVQECNLDGWT